MLREDRETRKQQFNENYGKLNVKVIPPNPSLVVDVMEREEIVGPYCRVSTMTGEQVESFEIQRKYYEDLIRKRPKWTLHRIYADEGISATSMRRRKDFRNLMADCHEHKVTLIPTKSVTRFARNVVDCISCCRELKTLNPPVGVLFETENIHTLAQSSEIQLDVFAMLAQSESKTKSASVKWGIRNRFAAGIPRIVKLYGYDLCRNTVQDKNSAQQEQNGGPLMINKEEASVVFLIFQLYLSNYPVAEIKQILEERGIPSPQGKPTWNANTIFYILMNERYVGDVMNQKTFVLDCFSHKAVKNKGQLPQYYWDDIVPPIIPRDMWKATQFNMLRTHWFEFLDMSRAPRTESGIEFYPINSLGRRQSEHGLIY